MVHLFGTNTLVAAASPTGLDAAGFLRRVNPRGAGAVDGTFFDSLGGRFLRIVPSTYPVGERSIPIPRA